MNDEQKSKLLARMKEGRAKVKAAREEAKAKGLPDPKPRKKRASKKDMANTATPADNSKIAPIDSAPPAAVNDVAAKPVDPSVSKSTPIDVPNLPGEGKKVASKKDIVKNPEAEPEAAPKKGIASSGKPADYEDNEAMRSTEVLKQTMEMPFPGQKDAIKNELGDKEKPLAPAPKPVRPSKTVEKVKTHVPDVKAVEGRAPFSFSAIRKVLYQ